MHYNHIAITLSTNGNFFFSFFNKKNVIPRNHIERVSVAKTNIH